MSFRLRPVPGCLWGCLLGVTLVGSVAACSDTAASEAAPAPSSASATPTHTEPPPPPTTLFSGREGKDHKVLAVKLDNTQFSHPHSGLMAADVVYLEEVEYGLTRFLAVFSSEYPKTLGPVRSARISDLELVRQYGKLAFAYSGAQQLILDNIARALVYPLSNDAGASGYRRDPNRAAPWDLFANPKQLLKGAPKATKAHDVGFTFDEVVPRGGKPASEVTATWPSANARFAWSKKQGRWLLWMDGSKAMSTEGPQLGGSTVIIQSVDVYPSQYGDSYGGVTPITDTVGRGKALLMRNGEVWPITWSRPKPGQGTTWEYRGKQIAMDPGQVWVILLDDDRRPQVRK